MDNLITWNVRNWITVVLMAILGWLIIMGIGNIVLNRMGAGSGLTGPKIGYPQFVGAAAGG